MVAVLQVSDTVVMRQTIPHALFLGGVVVVVHVRRRGAPAGVAISETKSNARQC